MDFLTKKKKKNNGELTQYYITDNHPAIIPREDFLNAQLELCLLYTSLVDATHGHTLVLFTSYSLMGAVYNQVKGRMAFPLMEVWRHSQDVIHRFKQAQNAVLFAAGSCWEGDVYKRQL